MHKYRAAAKRQAWYDDGDTSDPAALPNYNPFRKRRSRSKPHGDEENAYRIRTNLSENNAIAETEALRRSRDFEGVDVPKHANTMPSPSGPSPATRLPFSPVDGPISDVQDMAQSPQPIADYEREKESSQDSAPTVSSETAVASQGTSGGKARRRKFPFIGNSSKGADDPDAVVKPERQSSLFRKDTQKFTAVGQLKATILNSWINVLLIFVPIGIAVNYAGIPKVGVFVINFIAIIPLAAMLSYATEEIALRVGETLGGLLNATFGNAVELIVSILALAKDEVDIVQESLIGSILSNLLLVMGMCFFFGGLNRIEQHFNVTVAQTAASLLALAVGSLIIPAAFQAWADGTQAIKDTQITKLSRGTAILLLVVYGAYLFFQLKTHSEMYNERSQKVEKRSNKPGKGDSIKNIVNAGAGASATMGGQAVQEKPQREPEEEPETPQLSKWVALFTLAASTALVAICAEFMVDSIDAITQGGSVSRTFVGLILLPIVGNAAEHATAVTVACKDKMDLAIGVAVGSSMQIALLVIPFAVVLGWIMGKDDMNLAFDGFQIAVLFVAVLLVNYLIQDGKSHWLEGVLLQILYIIIALAAWFYPPDDPTTVNSK
ncbi:hypothetical protein ACLMJK_003312 [Lecanora helva]